MVTIYHNVNPAAHSAGEMPALRDLELAGIVPGTNSLDEAFDRTIHRDGENWTDDPCVQFFGDRRSRRSSHEGDVFVLGDGRAHLVLPQGFRLLSGLLLPFLPG
jgi:hypothetical protein